MTTDPFELLHEAIERMEANFMARLDQVMHGNPPVSLITESLLSADQIATEIKVAKSTVLKYARNNTIPSYKAGKRYVFKLSEVTEVLSSTAKIPKRKGTKIQ